MPQTSSEALKAASALKAAKMYYLQDLTMGAIATELRTSRSSVSRLLSFSLTRFPLSGANNQFAEIRRPCPLETGFGPNFAIFERPGR